MLCMEVGEVGGVGWLLMVLMDGVVVIVVRFVMVFSCLSSVVLLCFMLECVVVGLVCVVVSLLVGVAVRLLNGVVVWVGLDGLDVVVVDSLFLVCCGVLGGVLEMELGM